MSSLKRCSLALKIQQAVKMLQLKFERRQSDRGAVPSFRLRFSVRPFVSMTDRPAPFSLRPGGMLFIRGDATNTTGRGPRSLLDDSALFCCWYSCCRDMHNPAAEQSSPLVSSCLFLSRLDSSRHSITFSKLSEFVVKIIPVITGFC